MVMTISDEKIEVEAFDGHVHPRQGKLLKTIVPYTAKSCGSAIMILNYEKPVDTSEEALACKQEILANVGDLNFTPYMTLMLTKNTNRQTVRDAKKEGMVGFKLIPAGTSTGSENVGVTLFDLLSNKKSILQEIRDQDSVFLIHLELIEDASGNTIPLIKREEAAIGFLDDIINQVPGLKISVEHVTTRKLINYIVNLNSEYLGASLMPHYSCATYDMVCDEEGKVKDPLFYCLPILKLEDDRLAVIEFMTGDYPRKWFATDSAAHYIWNKIVPPYRAGLFTAPVAPLIVVSVFEEMNALSRLPAFFSKNILKFFGLSSSGRKTTFKKEEWVVPKKIGGISVFKGGETLTWQVS